MSYFGGRRDPKQAARDAIVGLRQQLQLLEKKEEHLQKKIDDEMVKARANAVSNKAGEFLHATMESWSCSRCTVTNPPSLSTAAFSQFIL